MALPENCSKDAGKLCEMRMSVQSPSILSFLDLLQDISNEGKFKQTMRDHFIKITSLLLSSLNVIDKRH